MRINGTPIRHNFPTKKLGSGGKGRGGCLPALVTAAALGTGWAHMLLSSWRAT